MWIKNYNKQYSIKVYDEKDPYNVYGGIEILPQELKSKTINSFNDLDVYLDQIDNSSGNLELYFPDKLINIIVDNSGSMSWNDPERKRFDIIKRFINKIGKCYSGDVKFSISKFGGKKINSIISASLLSDNPFKPEFNLQDAFIKDKFYDSLTGIYGVRILRKFDSFSNSPIDGEILFDGMVNRFLDESLTLDLDYYYSFYVFDSYNHFSDPVKIKIKTNDTPLDIAYGVQSDSFVGYGAKIDDTTIGSWHLNELSGDYVYDFSGNKLDCKFISTNIKTPIRTTGSISGTSGVLFTGVTSDFFKSLNSTVVYKSGMNLSTWVKSNKTDGYVLCGNVKDGTNYDWIIYSDASKIYVKVSDGTSSYINFGLNDGNWHHLSISISVSGNVSFYVDGVLFTGSGVLPAVSVGDRSFQNGYYFYIGGASGFNTISGEVSDLIIYSEEKDSMFIESLYNKSRGKFDNGDRILVVSYYIDSGENCIGGKSLLVYNSDHNPSNENDGNIIELSDNITVGFFVNSVVGDFIPGRKYYYKVFTEKDGIYSEANKLDDKDVTVYPIDEKSYINLEEIEIPKPVYLSSKACSSKNYLNWSLYNVSGNAKGFLLYFSKEGYPVSFGNTVSGQEILNSDIEVFEFVHEQLDNKQPYYYTLFCFDKYGRLSEGVTVNSTPYASLDNSTIPVKKLNDVSYSYIEGNSIKFNWDNLPADEKFISYFDEPVSFYAKIIDDFGDLIEENVEVETIVTTSYNLIEGSSVDVFSDGVKSYQITSSDYIIVSSDVENGYVKGYIAPILKSPNGESSYRNIKDIDFDIKLKLNYKDNNGSILYTYKTKSIVVKFINPLELKIRNREDRKIEVVSRKSISVLNNQGVSLYQYDGAISGASTPFVIRNVVSYKDGSSLYSGSLNYIIYEATKNLYSEDIPVRGNVVRSGVLSLSSGEFDLLDAEGKVTGEKIESSYSDIVINVPNIPKNYLIYVKSSFNSIEVVKEFFIAFDTNLKISINPNIPISNGVSSAQQFANVYLVDPDYPTDESKYTYPADGTIVKWELTPNSNSYPVRIIKSNDGIVLDSGTYSYATYGVSDNVFIGPISSPVISGFNTDGSPIYESHTLKASIVYGEKTASDSLIMKFVPLLENGQSISSSYLLMELDSIKQDIYADGVSYVKAKIMHDPSSSVSKYSECFRDSLSSEGKNIIPLSGGQVVFINSSESSLEIIHGDVIETVGTNGQPMLDVSNAIVSTRSASVTLSLSSNETYVYFRINKNVEDQKSLSFNQDDSNCGLLDYSSSIKYLYEINILANLTTVYNGGLFSLSSSLIPTILVPKNPLKISVVDRRVNGNRVGNLMIGDSSENEFLLDISYAGYSVQDGTLVDVQIYNLLGNSVKLSETSELVTTYKVDVLYDSTGRSYCALKIKPLSSNNPFESIVKLTVTYSVNSTSVYLNVSSDYENDSNNDLFSRSLVKSSGFGSSWSELSYPSKERASHATAIVNDNMYVFGGFNAAGVLGSVQRYNISGSIWEDRQDMITPRFGCQLCVVGDDVYIIGGVEYNKEKNILETSGKVEVYNTISNSWVSLSGLPEQFKIAFGASYTYSNTIYILSGVKHISYDGNVFIYNDRILKYDISLDSWSYSQLVDRDVNPEYFVIYPVFSVSKTEGSILFVTMGMNESDNVSYSSYSYDASIELLKSEKIYNNIENEFVYESSFCPLSSVSDDSIYIIGGRSDYSDFNSIGLKIKCDTAGSVFSTTDVYKYNENVKAQCLSSLAKRSSVQEYYLFGGLNSTKDKDNFIKIKTSILSDSFSLDGADRVLVKVELLDIFNNLLSSISGVDVKVNGYVQRADYSVVSSQNIEPGLYGNFVLLSSDVVSINNGIGFIYIEPRSDDFIESIIGTNYIEGMDNLRYRLVIQSKIESSGLSSIQPIDVTSDFTNIQQSIYNNSIDVRNFIPMSSAGFSRILPKVIRQNKVSSIDCYSYSPWSNLVVNQTLGFVEYGEAVSSVSEIEKEMEYGGSPVFDAIVDGCNALSDDTADNLSKNIYVFSDNEESLSKNGYKSVIDNILAVDGSSTLKDSKVGVVFSGINIKTHQGKEVKVNSYENENVSSILKEISGSSLSLVDYNFIDEFIGDITGRINGSVSYGVAYFIVDFKSDINVGYINSNVTLPANTGGNIRIEYSIDGLNFKKYCDIISVNKSVNLNNIKARYIKFFVYLYSGISISDSAIDDNTPTGNPVLNSIDIGYYKPTEEIILMNKKDVNVDFEQVSISIESDNCDNIEVGVSGGRSDGEWENYANEKKPSKNIFGKVKKIKRKGNYETVKFEKLQRVTGNVFKSLNGKWDAKSDVKVYDSNDVLIDSSEYIVIASDGIIIFKKCKSGLFYVEITSFNELNIGVKVVNSSDDTVHISRVNTLYK